MPVIESSSIERATAIAARPRARRSSSGSRRSVERAAGQALESSPDRLAASRPGARRRRAHARPGATTARARRRRRLRSLTQEDGGSVTVGPTGGSARAVQLATLERHADSRRVLEALHEVEDPELGMDIVDLGLLYEVEVTGPKVKVTYSLTSMGCPAGAMIQEDIERVVRALRARGVEPRASTFAPRLRPTRRADVRGREVHPRSRGSRRARATQSRRDHRGNRRPCSLVGRR